MKTPPFRSRSTPVTVALLACSLLFSDRAEAQTGGVSYWVYVANESSDAVSLVRFDGRSAAEEKRIDVGVLPTEMDGAHGVTVAPDGLHWYVSLAHGVPYGSIWKMRTGTDDLVDSASVGFFPATMALTPDGSTLLVSNFNLHGDPVASSVSAVFTPDMVEMARVETCVRPHGSRISRDGSAHYSGCLSSDQLVEIDTGTLQVTRRLRLTEFRDGLTDDGPNTVVSDPRACRPSWVVPSVDDQKLYVTCNGRAEVLEIERETLWIARRFSTGAGPYNADVTPDGRTLLVTLKGEQALAIIDLGTGSQTRIRTTRPVTHGVVVAPDGRYAFVSNEAVGATRGTLDVVDIERAEIVATAELHYQAGGISFWKMEGGAP